MCKQLYERLLNVECTWQEQDLSTAGRKVYLLNKKGKASGSSGVVTEMLKAPSDICSELIADLTNFIFRENTNQVNGMTVLFAACEGRGEAIEKVTIAV